MKKGGAAEHSNFGVMEEGDESDSVHSPCVLSIDLSLL